MDARARRFPALLRDGAAARPDDLLGVQARRFYVPGALGGSGHPRPRRGEGDAPARLPRRRAEDAARDVEPGAGDRRAQVLLPLPRRGGANRARPGVAAADAEEGGGAPGRADDARVERLLVQPTRGDLWERHFPGKPERDRLLLALFAYAGLRRSELLGLDWDDVDLSRRLVRIRKAKAAGSGRSRSTPRSCRSSPSTTQPACR
jgi:integrase